MTTCKKCKRRDTCAEICGGVERLLPKEMTGKDTHREINMDTDEFMAVSERCSYAEWNYTEVISRHPVLDLSVLTRKERFALLLLASGMPMRAAARRLNIKLSSFQKRVDKGRAKLLACHSAHIIEDVKQTHTVDERGGRK
jgi:hypothetical protein